MSRRAAPKVSLQTYVYCLVRAKRAPRLSKGAAGVDGTSAPRALDAGDGLWLIVSDAPGDQFDEAGLNARLKDLDWVSRAALAHQGVIEQVTSATAVLPMKLFTLFHGDGRATAFVDAERTRLERALDRVEGCVEFGVRLTLPETAGRETLRAAAPASRSAPTSGAAFLMRKKQLKDAAAKRLENAREAATALYASLDAASEESRRRTEVEGMAPGERLLLDGVFLVKASKAARFRSTVSAANKRLQRDGYGLVLNGPWPPYHFVADAA